MSTHHINYFSMRHIVMASMCHTKCSCTYVALCCLEAVEAEALRMDGTHTAQQYCDALAAAV